MDIISDRIGISDRTAVASATLQDLGVITEEDKTYLIDKVRIRRARSTNQRNLIKDSRYNQIMKKEDFFVFCFFNVIEEIMKQLF